MGPDDLILASVDELPRSLPHDLTNALCAAAVALAAGARPDGCRRALAAFRGLPHRVELVGEARGVKFYDDSKATTPGAVLAALDGFPSAVLIAGGRNKGLDLSVLRRAAGHLRGVVAIGEAAAEVGAAFSGVCTVVEAPSMAAAVLAAGGMARPGDAVVLSPACASFDWYSSYGARGDDFARCVAGPRRGSRSGWSRVPGAGERRPGARRPPAAEGSPPPLRVVEGERRAVAGAPGQRAATAISTRTALLALVCSLCGIGLVMVLSASAYTSLVEDGSVWTIFLRQVLWMALGGVALYVTSRMTYDRWRRVRVLLLVGTLLLLTAVLVPGIGINAGGSARWLGFGQLRIQPSELMKLALAVFAADLLARRADRVHEPGAVVVPLLVVLGVAGVLVLKQPDMGTALVLACITLSMLYAGGVPLRPVIKVLVGVAVLGVALGLAEPYRRQRLLSFLNPFAHAQGSGYQVVQSLVGLGSGRMFGLGLAAGREKWGLLPNAHTDFIFSVVGEQVGLVGALVVLALFAALAWYGLRAAGRAPDRFGALLAVAATCWITSQAVINIGAVIGLLPVTGIPLPFISFGGSSLVITMMAAGILVNVAAHEKPPSTAVRTASLQTPAGPRRFPAR